MRFIFLLVSLLILFGCGDPTEPVLISDREVEQTAVPNYPFTFSTDHFGKIKPGMTAEAAIAAYGTENLVFDTLYGPEGITYPGYRLFKGTDAEVEITFPEAGDPDSIGISIEVLSTGSPWREIESGIGVGTSLTELIRLNNRPINFYGFGWDYGGLVSDLNGGKLDGKYRYSLELDYDSVSEENVTSLLGDSEISSDHPNLKDAVVSVSALRLGL